jgi:hypothetical protein
MQPYHKLRYEVTYSQFGKRQIDNTEDKRVACMLASRLARITGMIVNVYETLRTPQRTGYARLLTTIRPR